MGGGVYREKELRRKAEEVRKTLAAFFLPTALSLFFFSEGGHWTINFVPFFSAPDLFPVSLRVFLQIQFKGPSPFLLLLFSLFFSFS